MVLRITNARGTAHNGNAFVCLSRFWFGMRMQMRAGEYTEDAHGRAVLVFKIAMALAENELRCVRPLHAGSLKQGGIFKFLDELFEHHWVCQ